MLPPGEGFGKAHLAFESKLFGKDAWRQNIFETNPNESGAPSTVQMPFHYPFHKS